MSRRYAAHAAMAVAIAMTVASSIARADDEETPRYVPASRGDRIAATEAVQRWRPLVSQYPWDVELALKVIR